MESENSIEGRDSKSSHAKRLFRYGLAASFVYSTSLGAYAWHEWQAMLLMKPEQFATFLSGVFAPLAFLWLVLGFRQQGDELQNSAQALWLQGEELRNSVEQQRQLVEVSRQQIEVDLSAHRRLEAEAEKFAQPILTMPGGGIQSSGIMQNISFQIRNAGSTCSDVLVCIDDEDEIVRLPVFTITDQIGFTMTYGSPDEIKQIDVFIKYNDARGRRKYQKFTIPAIEVGGPNGHRTLGLPFRESTESWDLI